MIQVCILLGYLKASIDVQFLQSRAVLRNGPQDIVSDLPTARSTEHLQPVAPAGQQDQSLLRDTTLAVV